MSAILAVLTSDPNLLRCELARLKGQVALSEGTPNALARGVHAPEEVLLERYDPQALPQLTDLVPEGEATPSLLFHSRELPLGMSLEDNTQPFRFRRWLFAHQGKGLGLGAKDFTPLRGELLATLPEYLQRSVRGDTDSELCFLFFLRGLRDAGRTDDPRVEVGIAAESLQAAIATVSARAQKAGSRAAQLNAVATNGRVLVAARQGAPLFHTVMEPTAQCEPCGLSGREPESHPDARAHFRRRTVVVASHVTTGRGWVEIPEGRVLVVSESLDVALR